MTDDELTPAAPLAATAETWLEREDRLTREREARETAEREANERRTDAAIARVKALAMDNGAGFCKACGVKFTYDDAGRAMHPANDCVGPQPRPCTICGSLPVIVERRGFRVWELTCGPSDHAAKLKQQNPGTPLDIQRPRRVGRDYED